MTGPDTPRVVTLVADVSPCRNGTHPTFPRISWCLDLLPRALPPRADLKLRPCRIPYPTARPLRVQLVEPCVRVFANSHASHTAPQSGRAVILAIPLIGDGITLADLTVDDGAVAGVDRAADHRAAGADHGGVAGDRPDGDRTVDAGGQGDLHRRGAADPHHRAGHHHRVVGTGGIPTVGVQRLEHVGSELGKGDRGIDDLGRGDRAVRDRTCGDV